ncbi:MAG: PAS domain S-box protein [Bacteroidia bacterium]
MEQFFDIDLTRWDMLLLYLVPASINFALFTYTIFYLPKNKTNLWFAVFVVFIAFWQTGEGMMRLSTNPTTADMWYNIMGIIAVFIIPFGMRFTFANFKIQTKYSLFVLIFTQFLPAILFVGMMLAGLDQYNLVKSENWHWVFNPIPSPATNAIYLWISLNGVFMLSILIYNLLKSEKGSVMRSQTFLLTIGFMIPLVGGLIGEVLLPVFLNMDGMPITTPLFTFFSLSALIAILYYRMFEYSPMQHWELIVESMNEGIVILNNHRQIMYANNAMFNVLGHNKDSLYGLDESELFVDNQTPKDSLNAEINKQFECRLKAVCGKEVWMIVSYSPYTDRTGKIIGTICLFTNIDLQKKAEDLITDEKNKLKLAIESGKMVSVEADFIKNTVNYSRNAIKLMGLDATVTDIRNSIEKNIHPDDVIMIREAIQNRLANDKIGDLQFRFIRPDNGDTIWLERRGETLLDVNGNPIGFQGILVDVTQSKKSEIKLKELLQITNDQNERLQNFTYIVSHNIRSHSANISGLVSFIKDSNHSDEFNMLSKSSEMLSETIENLNEIITFQKEASTNFQQLNLKTEINKNT